MLETTRSRFKPEHRTLAIVMVSHIHDIQGGGTNPSDMSNEDLMDVLVDTSVLIGQEMFKRIVAHKF